MRDFLRGCLVWLFGYPLSVVVATTVLTAPVWLMSYFPFDEGVGMVLGAAPVVGFFALVPALMTPRSPYVWPYVAAGTRTGAWCGLLTVSMYIIVLVSFSVATVIRALAHGHGAADEEPVMLLVALAWIVGAVAVFAVAGAAGGFVFGLVAAGPAQREALASSS